jgi:transcriptional regulator
LVGIRNVGKADEIRRNKRIRAKWLACWTQEEIAESEGMTRQAIDLIMQEFPELEKLAKSAATLATYSEPCSYTTPKQQRNAQE